MIDWKVDSLLWLHLAAIIFGPAINPCKLDIKFERLKDNKLKAYLTGYHGL